MLSKCCLVSPFSSPDSVLETRIAQWEAVAKDMTAQECSFSDRVVVLIVRDGWGVGKDEPGNAVMAAHTPVADRLAAISPHSTLAAAGTAVGLRPGIMGSSEVGHLNMGAGRIVKQEMTRVDEAIDSGALFRCVRFRQLVENCVAHGSAFHIMGLIQDQGVHADETHLHAILRYLRTETKVGRILVHFFADGRDTPPRSAMTYLVRLEEVLGQLGNAEVASVMGRYYGMDRGLNWNRTEQAYRALVFGEGRQAPSARDAILAAYGRADDEVAGLEEAPPETDEFISPTVITDGQGTPLGVISDGDSVLHLNYRQDRAIQLSMAFCEERFEAFDTGKRPLISYAGLTKYYDDFEYNILPPLAITHLLGEVISQAGALQLRISEYQKYRHVTSFFNGKRVAPFPLEDRVLVPSITIPEHLEPEMSAGETTELVIAAILGGRAGLRRALEGVPGTEAEFDEYHSTPRSRDQDSYSFIVVNLANCDMVGHTGVFAAAVRAVETVDKCTGRILAAVKGVGGAAIVTADHGNVEEMYDEAGQPQTAHSTNDVDLFLVPASEDPVSLRERGVLADIAPTVLRLLELEPPSEMTATSLLD